MVGHSDSRVHVILLQQFNSFIHGRCTIQQKADGGTGGQVHFVGFLMGLLIVAVDQVCNAQALLIDSVQRYIDGCQCHVLIGKALWLPILSESKEVEPGGRIRRIAILGLCVDDYCSAVCPFPVKIAAHKTVNSQGAASKILWHWIGSRFHESSGKERCDVLGHSSFRGCTAFV